MLTRLLAASGGSGSFLDVGYSMTADEVNFWSDQAALLDPLAYVFLYGTSQTHTVAGGERDYLISGWMIQGAGSIPWYHRQADFRDALPLTAGVALTTDASTAGSHMLICQPSLVTGSDTQGPGGSNRYATDPRALFFDRYQRIAELTQYELGTTDVQGGNNSVTATFPTDFTYGLAIHASQHDVAWVGLEHTGADLVLPILNEVSDTTGIRIAETCIFPFTRTTFPKVRLRGSSTGADQGRGLLRYLKLPSDW